MSANAEAITVMHRALDLLGRASADWRNGGHCEGTALHWPVAIDLGRRELQQALGTLDAPADEPTQDARAAEPADAWKAFKAWDAPR